MTPSHATEDDPPIDEPSVDELLAPASSTDVAPSADVAPELHDGGAQ